MDKALVYGTRDSGFDRSPAESFHFFLVFLPQCIFSILAYQAKILQLDWSTSGKGKGFITLHQTMQNRNSATLFETLSE